MNILYEDAKKLNDGTKKFSEFNKGDLYVLDGVCFRWVQS